MLIFKGFYAELGFLRLYFDKWRRKVMIKD